MSFETVLPPYGASDPAARFLSSSCLDFLLIEIVPMAYRVTNELEAAAVEPEDGAPAPAEGKQMATGGRKTMDEEEERDAVFFRLETLGYRVGQGLVERCDTIFPLVLERTDSADMRTLGADSRETGRDSTTLWT